MSELAFTTLRLGYLIILWLMVVGTLLVIRRDIYGTFITSRGSGRQAKPKKTPKPAKLTSMEATHLVVTEGPLVGSTLQLGASPILIGRSPGSTLVLEDDYASARHARIFPDQGRWWVEDLGSTNGTVVSGSRIFQPVTIDRSQRIRIGQTTLELR